VVQVFLSQLQKPFLLIFQQARKTGNGAGEGFCTSDPVVPKKRLGRRAECSQSLTVVLQQSRSCPIIPVRNVCKPSNGNPHQGVTSFSAG